METLHANSEAAARLRQFPFYPGCAGLFALLSVYASNTDQASPRELLVPAAIVLAATLLLLAIVALMLRGIHRAAPPVAAAVFFFLTYGNWVDILWAAHPDPRRRTFYHQLVLILQTLLLLLITFLAIRRLKDPPRLTPKLNRLTLVLLACPLLIVAYRTTTAALGDKPSTASEAPPSSAIANLNPRAPRPDIYFIVLDAHGRQDILRQQYHYDDSPFIEHLRGKGFYIADRSTSNYMWTEISVPAALNMRYLNDLPGDSTARTIEAEALLRNSALVTSLKTLGYRTVAFESVEKWLSLDNSNVYYRISNHLGFTPFQQLIVNTSALSRFGGDWLRRRLTLDQFHLKRELLLSKLAEMPRAIALPGPKFVFLHVMEPHTPFVFAADGSDPGRRGYGSMFDGLNAEVTSRQYHEWYRAQAQFVDNQVSLLVDKILASSKIPPVIVLIGDHGPRSGISPDPDEAALHECLSNLTAVYLPQPNHAALYPRITPVNLFRVVLNECFKADLPLLPDKSYYSYPDLFELRDVTTTVADQP